MTPEMSDDPTSEVEADRFYAAAGRCIGEWSFVDRAIYDVFAATLGTDPVKASIVYYRSPSVSDHLVLTDKLVTATLLKGSAERKAWEVLKKRINDLLPIRNKIAHHPVAAFEHETFSRDRTGAYQKTGRRVWHAYVDELRRHPVLDKKGRAEHTLASQIDLDALISHHSAAAALRRDLESFLEGSGDALRMPAPEPR